MSVTKDKQRNTWIIYSRYTDWQGNVKILHKRGFKTKREAVEYERQFLMKKSKDVKMNFEKFVEIYMEDLRPRLKYNTFVNKEYMIKNKILPYFNDKGLSDISPADVIQWQNKLLCQRDKEGKPYSPTYLRTIQNQLNAIFNHAVRFYDLPESPCKKSGKMGKAKAKEMQFWTKEEYLKFSDAIKDKPVSFYAFEMLYWCGIREGELLALTRKDVDLQNKKLYINKSLQVIKGEEFITTPKTEKSNRAIDISDFLCDELEDYFASFYKIQDDTRLFGISKGYLLNEMKRGSQKADVKRIRIHDLRHSHVAYLIELGFSAVEIGERLGHENISVTFTYAHLYPSKQKQIAEKINQDRRNDK